MTVDVIRVEEGVGSVAEFFSREQLDMDLGMTQVKVRRKEETHWDRPFLMRVPTVRRAIHLSITRPLSFPILRFPLHPIYA